MSGDKKKMLVPRLRFPEFREAGEWEDKSLAKVCKVLQGYGFPEALQGMTEGKYPFCKVSDISKAVADSGGVLTTAANYVGDDELLKLRAKLIPKGATVFAKIGEALRLNRRAFVQNACLIDNNVTGLKGIDGVADDYFVYLLSQLIDLNKYCGGAVPSVNKSTFEKIEVFLPVPDEQKKIANCLASLDDLITAQAKKLDTLKAHKKGLMQQVFPAEGETVPRLRFSEFIDGAEWMTHPFEHFVVKSFYGTSNPTSEKGLYPVLRMGNMVDGTLDLSKLVYIDLDLQSFKAIRLMNGDILLNRTNSLDLVGKISLFNLDFDCITASYIVAHRLDKERLDPLFCNFMLNTSRHQANIKALARPSISQANINPTTFRNELIISVPPTQAEQKKIADCLSSLDDFITAQAQKNELLKRHKKGLMQQLFPVLDEEPA